MLQITFDTKFLNTLSLHHDGTEGTEGPMQRMQETDC